MWDALSQYYGLDWVATGITLGSIYCVGDNRRIGFTLGVAGSVLWAIFGVMAHSIAGAGLNVVLTGLFLRGFLKWKPREARPPERAGVSES